MKKIITSCLAIAALAVGVATTLAQQQRVTTTKQKVGQRIETRGQASSRLASLRPSVAFAVTQPEKSAVTSVVVPGANTMFGGLMVYSDKWQTSESTPGVVSIQAREGGAISMVHSNKDMLNVKSAVKVNNIVYATAMNLSTYKIYVQEYSATSWTCTRNEETDMVNLASSLACDPTTGKIYGSFFNTETEYWDRFCSYSASLGEATDIANMDRDVHALAFNSQGELYGIWGATGWLVKIDKKTGSYVQVGKTGLHPISVDDYGVNSLAFGNDGALYWSATYQGTSSKDMRGGLFKIDTATGKATKVMDYPNNEGIAGLFAMADKVPDAAPDAVTDINVNFTADFANTATISFTAPTKTVNGASLTDPIMAIVNINGTQAAVVENIQPGTVATTPVLTLAEGLQNIEIISANATAQGNKASATTWVGEDIPAAATDVVLVNEDGKPHLTWAAPTTGLNGGKFKASELRYKIVRYPGADVVAEACAETQFTDNNVPGTMKSAYYEVTAYTGKGASTPAASNKIAVGDGYVVPFVEGFNTQDDFDVWTIIDNNDGSKWEYKSQSLFYNYNNDYIPGDDWAISPQIALRKGVSYKLSFDAKSSAYKKYVENFKAAIGNSPQPASMKTIKDYPNFQQTEFEKQSVIFSVDEDGYYYLGFYCYSDGRKGWSLTIDNVGVAEVSNNVPGTVGNLTVAPAPLGALKATVAFNAPTADAQGTALDAAVKINVYRDGTLVRTFAEAQPGEALSWLDEGVPESGIHTYRVVASNAAGEGAEAKAEAFVGVDVPGAAGNVTLHDVDGKAVISWTAPTTGSRGGWFDPSTVSYRVLRSDGQVVAEGYTSTTFTDAKLPASTSQQLIYYVITTYGGNAKGDYAVTPYCVFGNPYAAPLTEGFAGSDMAYYPWLTESDADVHQSWTLQDSGTNPSTADQNGDKGLTTFHSIGEKPGIHTSFSSPKISIASLDHPAVSFWMYHSHDSNVATPESIEVKVMADGGEWQAVDGAKWMRDNGSTGWRRHLVDLSAFKSSKYVRIAFVGTTAGGMDVHLDNITVDNMFETDAELTNIAGPKKIASGELAEYDVKVTNAGLNDLADIKVVLNDASGTQLAETTIAQLKADAQVMVTLPVAHQAKGSISVTAVVAAAADANAANNTKTITTKVVDPVIPVPQSLDCTKTADGLRLSWQSPWTKGSVTDDIESYKDWAIDNVGDWTMADLDHDVTYYISKDLGEYDNASSPKAFQVCNANTLGIDIWDEGKPHSGNKMLMAMAGVKYVNNDWLISPRLNGDEQTISFFARSFTLENQQPERMRVLYSTTDTDPANFTKIHAADYLELSGEWAEFRYVVPQGARYFAVNCVSDSGFAMFVDDLSFNDLTVPQLKLKEYEVYRNGVLLGKTSATEITDPEVVDGTVYTVRAIFDKTESDLSESITYKEGAVDEMAADTIRVATSKGEIIVIGAEGKQVTAASADGRMLLNAVAESNRVSIPATAGVYVVTVDGKSVKTIVR